MCRDRESRCRVVVATHCTRLAFRATALHLDVTPAKESQARTSLPFLRVACLQIRPRQIPGFNTSHRSALLYTNIYIFKDHDYLQPAVLSASLVRNSCVWMASSIAFSPCPFCCRIRIQARIPYRVMSVVLPPMNVHRQTICQTRSSQYLGHDNELEMLKIRSKTLH